MNYLIVISTLIIGCYVEIFSSGLFDKAPKYERLYPVVDEEVVTDIEPVTSKSPIISHLISTGAKKFKEEVVTDVMPEQTQLRHRLRQDKSKVVKSFELAELPKPKKEKKPSIISRLMSVFSKPKEKEAVKNNKVVADLKVKQPKEEPQALKRKEIAAIKAEGYADRGLEFMYALQDNKPQEARELLESGIDMDAKYEGQTWQLKDSRPLHFAAYYGDDLELVKRLIDNKADVNVRNKRLWTPLHMAASSGLTAIAEFLIASGADVNAKHNWGSTALAIAAGQNCKDLVGLLIKNKADLNAKDKLRTWTPLQFAALDCCTNRIDKEIVDLLINAGADITQLDPVTQSRLNTIYFEHRKFAKRLIKPEQAQEQSKVIKSVKAEPEAVKENKERADLKAKEYIQRGLAFMDALKNNKKEEARELLAAGIDINAQYETWPFTDSTPLHRAIDKGHEDIVKMLIDSKADVDVKDRCGFTPLRYAVVDSFKLVKLLIDNKADVNEADVDGDTLLQWAACNGYIDIVKLLIDSKANVNAKNRYGWTSLHMTASGGFKDIAEFLIASGADVDAKTDFNKTPLHFAVFNGRKDVVELLIKSKADLNIKDNSSCTPLQQATFFCYEKLQSKDIVDLLLKAGADINQVDQPTLSKLFSIYNTKNILEMIKKAGTKQ